MTSPKPHYLLVLNPNPESAEIIVLGVITSGIEKAKMRVSCLGESENTLVMISPEDYPELNHDSVIDCNSPVKYSKWEFESSFGQIVATRKSDISLKIVHAVIAGVLLSNQVSERIKKELKICYED